jgi:hypothetical protein
VKDAKHRFLHIFDIALEDQFLSLFISTFLQSAFFHLFGSKSRFFVWQRTQNVTERRHANKSIQTFLYGFENVDDQKKIKVSNSKSSESSSSSSFDDSMKIATASSTSFMKKSLSSVIFSRHIFSGLSSEFEKICF